MSLLVATLIALVPRISLRYVSTEGLRQVNYIWLLGLLAVGSLWLIGQGEAWLGLIGCWFLCRWRTPELRNPLLRWAALGATWGLLLAVPRTLWPWIALAWVGWACLHGVAVAYRALRIRPWRQKGWAPSPVMTALSLALVTPFAPWWAWPFLAVGLGLTCSWVAILGVGVGWVWLYPGSWLLGAVAALTGGILLGVSRWQRRFPTWVPWLEWTPRGDSLDGVRSRLVGWAGLGLLLARQPRWWWGRGPDTTEAGLLEVSSRSGVEVPLGDACNDLVQLTVEYGILGVLAAGAFVWRIAPHLTLGDPWSAAWIVGAVLSLAHYPLRYPPTGLVWLAVSAKLVTT